MVEENRHPEGAGGPRPAQDAGGPAPAHEGDGHAPPGELLHPEVRSEHSDASFRWVFGLILGAMVFAAIVQYVILRFFYSYEDYQAKIKASHYPLATQESKGLPPEPRLEQLNRTAEIQASNVYLRQSAREAVLRGYGATGEEGYVHIPIDRAMDLLADELPSRKDRPAAGQRRRQGGLVDYGESNSGRVFREKAP